MYDVSRESLGKYIKMTGERAKIDAKIFDTCIIYKNKQGETIREYPDGKKVIENDDEE